MTADIRLILKTVAALAAWTSCTGTFAQSAGLPDPTRPPPGFVGEVPAAGGVAGDASAGVAVRGASASDESAQAGLQSVLIPRRGKPVAIIGGKYVPLGERYGEYELVAVSESEVVLARGKERKVMKLTPGAEKKVARANPGDDRKAQVRPARTAVGNPPSRKESETGR
jgi:MSHA biogenesis protein MshK